MSMAHNVWLEYPCQVYVEAINRDGKNGQEGVTFVPTKNAEDFINDGKHPRIFIQSKGQGDSA